MNHELSRGEKTPEDNFLERLDADGMVDYILSLGMQAAEIERKMNNASLVLEQRFGTTVEEVLGRKNEQTESSNS